MAKKHLSPITVLGDKVVPIISKSITILNPAENFNITLFFTEKAITIKKMHSVVMGSSSPSQSWTVRHGTSRTGTGNEVVTGGSTTSSTTTGTSIVSFNDATIPANSFVWIRPDGAAGTVSEFHLTLFFTEDI